MRFLTATFKERSDQQLLMISNHCARL